MKYLGSYHSKEREKGNHLEQYKWLYKKLDQCSSSNTNGTPCQGCECNEVHNKQYNIDFSGMDCIIASKSNSELNLKISLHGKPEGWYNRKKTNSYKIVSVKI